MIKEFINKYPWQVLTGLVVAVAAVLRLYDFDAWSLSNDELSAINRLRVQGFGQLIDEGVKPDFHPAGVQFFLYLFTKIFGYQPYMIRLPFVLAGIASVWLTYLIGKQWFSKTTGLLAASFMAFLPYLLLYSQLARPYSFGLVFTLALAWYWGKYFIENDHRPKVLVGFAAFSALSLYTHYFSFMMTGLFIMAGFLFVKRKTLLPYIFSIIAIALLYLPHIGIFIHQMAKGGVGGDGGWLSAPDSAWIGDYLFYAFGASAPSILLLIGLVLLMAAKFSTELKITKKRIMLLAFFVMPFLIGYFYSIYVNPVLQFSVLLFAFPFLLIVLFSFWNDAKLKLSTIMVLVALAVGSWVATDGIADYRNGQFADFKQASAKMKAWERMAGKDGIQFVAAINHPYYLEYYFEQNRQKSPSFYVLEDKRNEELAELASMLDTSRTKYFAYIRLKPAPADIPDVIAGTYPYLIERTDYFGQAEVYLFTKDSAQKRAPIVKPVTRYFCDFEQMDEFFGVKAEKLDTARYVSGAHSLRLSPNDEWGPTIKIKTGDANLRFATTARIKVSIFSNDVLTDSPIVFSITDRFGKDYIWDSGKMEYFVKPGKWCTAFLTVEIPHPSSIDDELKVFVWNKDKKELWIDDFTIEFYKK